jgi:hypothetical protein
MHDAGFRETRAGRLADPDSMVMAIRRRTFQCSLLLENF